MFLFALLLAAALILGIVHRHRVATAVLVVAAVVAFPMPVLAQDVVAGDGSGLGSITLSALTVEFLIAMVIPIATGLLTKSTLPGLYKGLITLILNAANAAIVQATIADGGAFFSKETIIVTLMGLGISVATYLGIYQNAGLTSSAENGKLYPTVGIG